MKKIYTFLVLVFTVAISDAQIVSIPDANFKAKLLSASTSNSVAKDENLVAIKIDTNDDGQIQVSEALTVYWLAVNQSSIGDLTGISSFVNLRKLICGSNYFTSLNIDSLVNLQELYCDHSMITSININNLTNLNSADFGTSALTTLSISNLPNFYTLNTLISSNLTSLTLSNCPMLSTVDTQNCHLNTLTITNCPQLFTLKCNTNYLQSLDVSACSVMYELACDNNQLTSLLFPASLNKLNCSYNYLTSLALSNSHNLSILSCINNNLTTLDLNNTSISNTYDTFQCSNNNLVSLYIKNGYSNYGCFFNNNPNLAFICVDDDPVELEWFQGHVTDYGYTNCVVNTYCSFTPGGTFYTIQGNHRWDINNNGCDNSDFLFPNMKFNIAAGANSATLISGGDGSYHYNVQAGTYTITPVIQNPSYFTVSPSSASVTFPTVVSPFTQNFCVTPNGVHNDLEISMFPISSARPGFDAKYKIIYKNKGNSTQSGTVSLDLDETILDLISANPSISSQVNNTLNWDFSNLLPFETKEILVVLNLNSPLETPAVNAGNLIIYTATVTGATDETTDDNTAVLTQTVVNSFDPNDKTCTEGNVLPTYKVGSYVHYIIRFENNGSAPAENIVVKDMIDTSKYDISSLVPLSSSAPFSTRITNTNKVEFIFENINLPFGDANNDGYVAFKIKTKPTLVDGDNFSNSASIYFDYNAAIVTNPYTTTVFNPLAIADFDFNSSFSLSPVPTKDVLTITLKQALTMSSANIYNTLGQLVQVNTNPNETIDVSGLKTGSYFIKIVCDKGTSSGKFLKE